MSDAVEVLIFQLRAVGLPEPVREYKFHDTRKWRFDLAWPDYHVAAEVDGGTYANGRHTRGEGFAKDCEKLNTAALGDWLVFRFTTTQAVEGTALNFLQAKLIERGAKLT